MNTKHLVKSAFLLGIILVSVASGWTGYRLGGPRMDGSMVMPAETLPGQDYLTAPESFSRIGNTRNSLDGLCVRLRLEIQKGILAHDQAVKIHGYSAPGVTDPLESAIHEAERAMNELTGTDLELDVAQDLFLALKMVGRFDRWTEVYLKALYQHPTHPVVARLAREAISIGRLAGQEESVLSGLRFVSSIPLEFEGKPGIEGALSAAQPVFGLTEINVTPNHAYQ